MFKPLEYIVLTNVFLEKFYTASFRKNGKSGKLYKICRSLCLNESNKTLVFLKLLFVSLLFYVSFNPSYIEKGEVMYSPEQKFLST